MLFGLIKTTEDAKTQGKARSPRWPYFVKKLIEAHPYCSACGSKTNLIGHHIKPYHLHPELELEPTNIAILCESRGKRDCHFLWGHLGVSWEAFNPDVVPMTDAMLKLVQAAKG